MEVSEKGSFFQRVRALLLTLTALLLGAAPASAATPSAPRDSAFSAEAPGGFDGLLQPQVSAVDLYYGGRKLGSAVARFSPGKIKFINADKTVSMIPHVAKAELLRAALEVDLPTHAERNCSEAASETCGRLSPDTIGVIFDEGRFRADLFVNPAYLDVDTPMRSRYLPEPTTGPSVAATLSGVVSGSDKMGATYDLQGRVIAAYKNIHLLAEVSQSSTLGPQVETVAATADRGRLRYQAGLMWSPGLDLIGQGRFYGASVGTQTDTLANRDLVSANPVLIYLSAKSQVDVLRSGHLLSSRWYEAGNHALDTSALPEGAYMLILRIREVGGFTREEKRFFSKSHTLPPLGLPQMFAAAGLLAGDGGGGFPTVGRRTFGELGFARRLTASFATDAAVAYVEARAIGQAGLTYASANGLRLRLASTASSRGEYGALLSTSWSVASSVVTVDVRQGWSRWTVRPDDVATVAATAVASASGYTQNSLGIGLRGSQVSASYAFATHGALFGLVGSYTASRGQRTSYAFGPTFDIPVRIARAPMRLVGDFTKTERGLQAFLGLRFQFNRNRSAAYGAVGVSATNDGAGGRYLGPAIDLAAATERSDPRLGELAGTVELTRSQNRSSATAEGRLRSEGGDVELRLDQDLSGPQAATHYSAGFRVGAVATPSRLALGSASGGDSGVLVSVTGAPRGSEFEVLVDDAPRARLKAGRSLPLLLPSYRAFRIRLAPRSGAGVDFDTADRTVSLFPGNVEKLTWKAEQFLDVYGRILDQSGRPLANALIEGGRYPNFTDDHGYFQVQSAPNARLVFKTPLTTPCSILVHGAGASNGRLPLGTQACIPIVMAGRDRPPFEVAQATGRK